jgi:hypothetical protein
MGGAGVRPTNEFESLGRQFPERVADAPELYALMELG